MKTEIKIIHKSTVNILNFSQFDLLTKKKMGAIHTSYMFASYFCGLI